MILSNLTEDVCSEDLSILVHRIYLMFVSVDCKHHDNGDLNSDSVQFVKYLVLECINPILLISLITNVQ